MENVQRKLFLFYHNVYKSLFIISSKMVSLGGLAPQHSIEPGLDERVENFPGVSISPASILLRPEYKQHGISILVKLLNSHWETPEAPIDDPSLRARILHGHPGIVAVTSASNEDLGYLRDTLQYSIAPGTLIPIAYLQIALLPPQNDPLGGIPSRSSDLANIFAKRPEPRDTLALFVDLTVMPHHRESGIAERIISYAVEHLAKDNLIAGVRTYTPVSDDDLSRLDGRYVQQEEVRLNGVSVHLVRYDPAQTALDDALPVRMHLRNGAKEIGLVILNARSGYHAPHAAVMDYMHSVLLARGKMANQLPRLTVIDGGKQ